MLVWQLFCQFEHLKCTRNTSKTENELTHAYLAGAVLARNGKLLRQPCRRKVERLSSRDLKITAKILEFPVGQRPFVEINIRALTGTSFRILLINAEFLIGFIKNDPPARAQPAMHFGDASAKSRWCRMAMPKTASTLSSCNEILCAEPVGNLTSPAMLLILSSPEAGPVGSMIRKGSSKARGLPGSTTTRYSHRCHSP